MGKLGNISFRTSPETHARLLKIASILDQDVSNVVNLLVTLALPTLSRTVDELKVGIEQEIDELTGDSGGPS